MSTVLLQRVDCSRNMRRFYRLDVERDLFGVWLFTREWGRIGCRGQMRVQSFVTNDETQFALQRQRHAKVRKAGICVYQQLRRRLMHAQSVDIPTLWVSAAKEEESISIDSL
jgi:predicted DNA-binding WGR domain protein